MHEYSMRVDRGACVKEKRSAFYAAPFKPYLLDNFN